MSLREKFMKLPLWKAAILVFLAGFIFMSGMEHLFFSKIFTVIDNMITRFDVMFKQDAAEYDADWKKREERWKKERAESDAMWKKSEEESRQRRVEDYCHEIKTIKAINEYVREYESPNYKPSKEFIINEWRKERVVEYKNEAQHREERMKTAYEMLASDHASENDCSGTIE